ncbi:MAG: DUF2442 domain-containing protein [Gemmobacter sp.]
MAPEIEFDEAMYAAAAAEGERVIAEGVLAKTAFYDARAGRLIVDLVNGVTVTVPVALIQDLCDATDEQRREIEISPVGYGLHWPALDLDLSIPGLMSGIFGTKAWMNRQRAARAGSGTSPAKAAAARANGAKGGRPKKTVA